MPMTALIRQREIGAEPAPIARFRLGHGQHQAQSVKTALVPQPSATIEKTGQAIASQSVRLWMIQDQDQESASHIQSQGDPHRLQRYGLKADRLQDLLGATTAEPFADEIEQILVHVPPAGRQGISVSPPLMARLSPRPLPPEEHYGSGE